MLFFSILNQIQEPVKVSRQTSVSKNNVGFESNLSDVVRSDGQEVDFISEAFRRLHCGDVGVYQNRLDVLLLQSLYGLEEQKTSIFHFWTYKYQ